MNLKIIEHAKDVTIEAYLLLILKPPLQKLICFSFFILFIDYSQKKTQDGQS